MSVNKKHFKIVNQIEANSDNTIVIVGAAADGPARTPILPDPNLNAVDLFGHSPLAEAYTAVRSAGVRKIVTYRINGIHSRAIIKHITATESKDIIELRAVSASHIYNDIRVTVYPDYIYIDETVVGGATRSYFFEDYPTAHDLAYGINRDAHYGMLFFTAHAIDEDFTMSGIVTSQTTVAFTDGLAEDEFLVNRLEDSTHEHYISAMKTRITESLFGYDPEDQTAYTINSELGVLHFGVILLAGIYHDDDSSITRTLGEFCMSKTKHMESGCIGVIGTKPLIDTGLESIKEKVNNLNNIAASSESTESGSYVQVIIGDSYYDDGTDYIPTAYAYAGTQAFYPYHTIMTNKKIAGFSYLNYQIPKEDIDLLSSNGYTCIVPSIRKGFVSYLASTYTKDKKSPMSKPHCIRISQYVSRVLSKELDYLVGTASSSISHKDIVAISEDLIQELVDNNIIRSFSVKCIFTPRDKEAHVDVTLTPFSEVTSIASGTVVAFPREVI